MGQDRCTENVIAVERSRELIEPLCSAVNGARHPGPPHGSIFQPTSVMALMGLDPEPFLLLIQKADSPGYPWRGQMAFPGGHVDPGDPTRLDTALRELEEETSIAQDHVSVVGSLGHYQTINNRDIEAFFGLWDQEQNVVWDPSEISRAVEIPVRHLRDIHREKGFEGHTPDFSTLTYPWEDMVVWGVTAKIIHHFIEITEPVPFY